MHQTTISRKAIYIPHSIDVIALDELASRLAATIHDLSLAKVLRADFVRAGGAGQLVIRHPVAHVPVQPDTQGAVVLVDDAASYLAESGSRFRITRYAEALPFVGLHPEELVPLDDVPMLVANAIHDPETESEWHGFKRLVIEKRIYEAANCGRLAMFDPLSHQRLSVRTTGACVTAGDLRDFFSGSPEKQPPVMAPINALPEPWDDEDYACHPPAQWDPERHPIRPKPDVMTLEEIDEGFGWGDATNEADAAGLVERQNWSVVTPKRYSAYGAALQRYLLGEWRKGRLRKPTARDVMEAWQLSRPQGIYEVMEDGLKYIDNEGDVKELSRRALKAAINRMTETHD